MSFKYMSFLIVSLFLVSCKTDSFYSGPTENTDTNPAPQSGTPVGETSSNNNEGVDPRTEGSKPTEKDIERTCQNFASEIQSFSQQISFVNDKQVCKWSLDGNLSPINVRIRARKEERRALNLPAGAVVCDASFVFPKVQNIKYDDEIFFLFNDVVIASTTNYQNAEKFNPVGTNNNALYMKNYLEEEAGLFRFDWLKIKDMHYSQEDRTARGIYCLGDDKVSDPSYCQIPATETTGNFHLEFNQDVVYQLSALAQSSAKKEFGLVTTGDNNTTDCQHTDIYFTVNVSYLPAK